MVKKAHHGCSRVQTIASDEKDLPSLSLCSFSRYLASPLGGEEVLVNQVGACIIYIGDVLDYGPATSAEERVRMPSRSTPDYISEGCK
jgi:hypothetical protein